MQIGNGKKKRKKAKRAMSPALKLAQARFTKATDACRRDREGKKWVDCVTDNIHRLKKEEEKAAKGKAGKKR